MPAKSASFLGFPARFTLLLVLYFLASLPCPAVSPPPPHSSSPDHVVLVHGFTDTGAIFNRLVATLEKQGCRCFAPTLQPNNFRYGVHDLTRKLSAEIDRHLGPRQPFVLVALSMGGLVARDYVQNLHGSRRVRAFFEIATANRGTLWANTSPGGPMRDFAVGGPFLRALNADVSAFDGIPVQAYWTPLDLVVIPATNAKCAFGQNKRVFAPFHQSMVKNRTVIADIAAKIAALPPAKSPQPTTHILSSHPLLATRISHPQPVTHPTLPPFTRAENARYCRSVTPRLRSLWKTLKPASRPPSATRKTSVKWPTPTRLAPSAARTAATCCACG